MNSRAVGNTPQVMLLQKPLALSVTVLETAVKPLLASKKTLSDDEGTILGMGRRCCPDANGSDHSNFRCRLPNSNRRHRVDKQIVKRTGRLVSIFSLEWFYVVNRQSLNFAKPIHAYCILLNKNADKRYLFLSGKS
jgi:hypothetical protein